MDKPFGDLDPNSQHQLWSRWSFSIQPGTRHPTCSEVITNSRKYFKMLFGTDMGRVRCHRGDFMGSAAPYGITLEIEGPAVHDVALREYVKKDFTEKFVGQGFGVGARLVGFEAGLLAGDAQDGKPPAQFLVVPGFQSMKGIT